MKLNEMVKRAATELLEHRPECRRRGIVHSEQEKGIQNVYISTFCNEERTYVALANGKFCTAIHNVFNGLYYVDDIYGVIED